MSVPTPGEMDTRNSSPSFSVTLGFAVHPTPAGVLVVSKILGARGTHPVRMIVPGSSVVPWDRNAMICGTEKIKSLESVSAILPGSVPTHLRAQSCLTSPLSSPLTRASAKFVRTDL